MKSQLKKLTAIFLSICVVLSLTSIISFAAETKTYTFSSYTAGTQYGKNEVHELDSNLTVVTNNCHFTSELRIYSSITNNGYAILKTAANKCFSGLKFNAGNKKDTLNVYGSNDEGATWTLIQGVAITSTSYKDYTVSGTFTDNAGNPYTWLKLDVAGTNQVRIAKMTVTFVDAPSGGDDTSSTPSEGESSSSTPSTPDDDEDPSSGTTSTPTESASAYYEKVTEAPADWSGDYLIVYETGKVAFDGSLTTLDAESNTKAVTITNNKIEATDAMKAIQFTITKSGSNYMVKSASGYYIGRDNAKNGLDASKTTQYTHSSITISSGNVILKAKGGYCLNYNKTTGQTRFRYFNNTQEPIALYKYVEAPAGSIKGASVDVGSDLTMNFYVDAAKLTKPTMTFTMDGKEKTATILDSDEKGTFFAFEGVPPHCMTETITANLYDGDELVATKEYSVQKNIQDLLNGGALTADQKQFVSNMLHYGDAAQNYKGNNDVLATEGVKNLLAATTELPTKSDVAISGTVTDVAYFKSANVWFDNVNKLIVKFQNLPANAKLLVNGTEVSFDGVSYMTEGILASDFDKIYNFTIANEQGDELQTLTYSVNSYVYAKRESAAMKELATALYNYGLYAEKLV